MKQPSKPRDFFASGEVVLMGAGPGDPDLLTIKAAKYLAAADVVLVDDLVSPELLELAHPKARIIHVGKRGGCSSTPQKFIEKMMLNEAMSGNRVVRLKGGDPMMFGRAGEEISALSSQGIKVTLVNGISSGFAAATACGVSLTHRDYSAGVIFVTGHLKDDDTQPNWEILAKAKMTLVVYMGLARANLVQEGLIAGGMSRTTPVGLVHSASTTKQRVVYTQLQYISKAIQENRLESPMIMLIGDVLKALSQLDTHALAA